METYHGDNEDGLQHVLVRPIVNHLAKYRYVRRTDRKKYRGWSGLPSEEEQIRPSSQPVRIRPVCGFPGLKVVCASTPEDAKGLLKAAIRDDDPVFFCERGCRVQNKGEVPVDPDFIVPIGKSRVVFRATR